MSLAGAIVAMLSAILIPLLIIQVLMIISWWKVFSKAGEPGWAILIPIYNVFVMCNVAKKPGIWVLLIFLLGIIFIWPLMISIAKNFGKGAGFGVGMVLLPVIFVPILAFSKSAVYNPEPAHA
jgi:hypothetical protein